MPPLPEQVSEAWERRKDPVVFSTVDTTGVPNVIYASYVLKYDDERVVIADSHFHKTRANIGRGSRGAILFITDDNRPYQIKGALSYLTEGPIVDALTERLNPKMPGLAAAVLHVEEVYSGADKLL
jgi:hypothetical protein